MSNVQVISLAVLAFGFVFFFGAMVYLHKLNTKSAI